MFKGKTFLRFKMYIILKKGDLCFEGHLFIFIQEDSSLRKSV